jgi:GT2 family glycosyltransferase
LISIIVVTHNKQEMVQACLDALMRSELPMEYEVILVDNASSKEIGNLAGEFREKARNFRYWRNDENLSFSIANNAAAERARGDWLLFLNNDVVIREKSLKELFQALVEDNTAGIAGARLLSPENGKVQHAGIEQMLWGYASNYGAGADPGDPRLSFKRPVFAVTGAMLGISRRLFNHVNGFDERYRWGYEDLDLCHKVKECGRSIRYVPEAESFHWESATLRDNRNPIDVDRNYRFYRKRWDYMLIPRERKYLEGLRAQNIRRVIVFGTGKAAIALWRWLKKHDIDVEAFTSSSAKKDENCFCGRPVVPLANIKKHDADSIMVGSQFYFEVEKLIREADPHGRSLFPIVS